MKSILCILFLSLCFYCSAQEEAEEKKGFKAENLFTGGSVSVSFFNSSFLIGGNPVFGYNLTRWADVGLVGNYQYTSFRDYNQFDDRLRQTIMGGGVFARLFPVKFLFVQGQAERNWIKLKYIPPPNSGQISRVNWIADNSILVGGGYSTGRDPNNKSVFGYLAVLFDVSGSTNSPYTDGAGRAIPIIRAGIQIPLFQPKNENF